MPNLMGQTPMKPLQTLSPDGLMAKNPQGGRLGHWSFLGYLGLWVLGYFLPQRQTSSELFRPLQTYFYGLDCSSLRNVMRTPPGCGAANLSTRLSAAGADAVCGFSYSGCKAERRAPSTSSAQWIFIGGSGPNSPASCSVFRERASSGVLPRINSVARLATA